MRLIYKIQLRKGKEKIRVVIFYSNELEFDDIKKLVKLIYVAIISKPCCEILCLFGSARSHCSSRDTKHDQSVSENIIETRLAI